MDYIRMQHGYFRSIALLALIQINDDTLAHLDPFPALRARWDVAESAEFANWRRSSWTRRQ
jgi:hypothetical protein